MKFIYTLHQPLLLSLIMLMVSLPSSANKSLDQIPILIKSQGLVGLPVVQTAKLLPTPVGGGGSNSLFGSSVAIEGTRAVIGAPNINGSGVVYVYDFDGVDWQQTAELEADDGGQGDQFGYALSLSGDRIMVGAYKDDDVGRDTGAVYVYEWGSGIWNQSVKLTVKDIADNKFFGGKVELLGDWALISSYIGRPVHVYELINGQWLERQILSGSTGSMSLSENRILQSIDNEGLVNVYDLVAGLWTLSATLMPEDVPNDIGFGRTVDQVGDRITVGAPRDNDEGENSGAVYVYDLISGLWTQSQKITEGGIISGKFFGENVELGNDRMVISATSDDTYGDASGAAYVYELEEGFWSQTSKIIAPDSMSGDFFGGIFSLSNDTILVGVPWQDGVGLDAGAAYFFEHSNNSWDQTKKVLGESGASLEHFGNAINVSGNTVVIGASDAFYEYESAGAVYVFSNINGVWELQQKLTSPDLLYEQRFGNAVSLLGNRLVIGASNDQNGTGSVYIYENNGENWMVSQMLIASDGEEYDYFGAAVASHDDYVFVGSPRNDSFPSRGGAVYVFENLNGVWVETDKLRSNNGTFFDLGLSLSSSGDRLVAGAYGGCCQNQVLGTVFVYDLVGGVWVEAQRLVSEDLVLGDRFGESVSLSGDRVLVGAKFSANTAGFNSGSAYVFDFSGGVWSQTQKLQANDTVGFDFFGGSVSLDGDKAVVGSPYSHAPSSDSGAAYVYQLLGDEWQMTQKLKSNDGLARDLLGYAVKLSGDQVMLGAIHDDNDAVESGSVSVFEFLPDLIFADGFESN